jgi:hypothetical protein
LLCDTDGRRRCLYSLRHFYATDRLLHGDLDPLTLAQNMGTSVAQIQRHYSHVTNLQNATRLTHDKRRNPLSEVAGHEMGQAIREALASSTALPHRSMRTKSSPAKLRRATDLKGRHGTRT